jgi:hypothetical protein
MTPGPKEPKVYQILFKRTAEIFKKFGPLHGSDSSAFGWAGLQIHITGLSGRPEDLGFFTRIYFTGLHSDSKARWKAALENTCSAYNQCSKCKATGELVQGPRSKHVVHKGYYKPSPQYRYVCLKAVNCIMRH